MTESKEGQEESKKDYAVRKGFRLDRYLRDLLPEDDIPRLTPPGREVLRAAIVRTLIQELLQGDTDPNATSDAQRLLAAKIAADEAAKIRTNK